VVAAAFGRTLGNGFAFDDFPVLVDNPAVTDPAPPARILGDARTHGAGDVVRAYRPLRTLVFAAEHALFGLRPWPWHAVNVILHAACAVLAAMLLARLLPRRTAWIAALLWAGHPLLTEVVASVKAQDDLMAAAAVLSALLIFDRGLAGARGRWLVVPLFAAGLLAKENVIALPPLLLGLWLARGRPAPAPWRLLAALLVVTGAYLALRGFALRAVPASQETTGLPWLFPSSLAWAPWYARLFLWPFPLTADWSQLGLVPPTWIALSVAAQLIVLGFAARSRHAELRLSLAWFYLALLPSLNPVTSFFVFAERFAYLPALGLAAVAAAALVRIPRVTVALAAGAVIALAARSAQRCGDWKDSETLFRAALAVNPEAAVMRSFLARELLRQGRTEEAERLLPDIAEGGAPRSASERAAMAGSAMVALQREQWERAAAILEGVAASPFAKTADWLNLGTALTNLARYADAERAFAEVLRRDPADAGALRMLGRIALERGDWTAARERFEEACHAEPDDATGWYGAALAARRAAGDSAAIAVLERARARGVSLEPRIREGGTEWEGVTRSLDRSRGDAPAGPDPPRTP
jgi:tetratricopeptide (TPR) repeat protein